MKETLNAFKVAYKVVRENSEEIYKAFGLKHLSDATQYYDQLKEIYPNLIACNDLNRLTGQLLGLIAKLL